MQGWKTRPRQVVMMEAPPAAPASSSRFQVAHCAFLVGGSSLGCRSGVRGQGAKVAVNRLFHPAQVLVKASARSGVGSLPLFPQLRVRLGVGPSGSRAPGGVPLFCTHTVPAAMPSVPNPHQSHQNYSRAACADARDAICIPCMLLAVALVVRAQECHTLER